MQVGFVVCMRIMLFLLVCVIDFMIADVFVASCIFSNMCMRSDFDVFVRSAACFVFLCLTVFRLCSDQTCCAHDAAAKV